MKLYTEKYRDFLPPRPGDQFATEEDIRANYNEVDMTEDHFESSGIPILTDDDRLYLDGGSAHTGIWGGTGSGKTRRIIMPALNTMIRAGESFVIADPKGELGRMFQQECRDRDYIVYEINLRDFSAHAFNPLRYPYHLFMNGKEDEAAIALNELVSALSKTQRETTNDRYFVDSASMLLLGIMLLLFILGDENEINLASVLNMSNEANREKLMNVVSHLPQDSLAGSNLRAALETAENTRMCTVSMLAVMLQPLALNQLLINNLSSPDAIDLTDIYNKKTAIFLNVADESTTYHFLATIFLKQLYEILISQARQEENGMLPIRMNFVLDEFANIPAINDFDSAISAARSRNIRYFLVLQSQHQLFDKYGENDGRTIIANLSNIIFLQSRELPLLQELEALCGRKDKDGPLLSVSQLQRFQQGQMLMLLGRLYPFVTELPDISSYKEFQADASYKPIRLNHPRASVYILSRDTQAIEHMLKYYKSKKKEREKGLDPYLRGCPEAYESSEFTEKLEHLESDTGGPSYEELLGQLNSIFVEVSLNDDHPAADADDE